MYKKVSRFLLICFQLTHPNIVCYKTAWLEPYLPSIDSRRKNDSADAADADSFTDSAETSSESYDGGNPLPDDGCDQYPKSFRNEVSVTFSSYHNGGLTSI